jgi:hypothetical protein
MPGIPMPGIPVRSIIIVFVICRTPFRHERRPHPSLGRPPATIADDYTRQPTDCNDFTAFAACNGTDFMFINNGLM